MQRRHIKWVVTGIVGGLIVIVLGMTALNERLNSKAGATTLCPTDWVYSQDRSVTLACSALNETVITASNTQYALTEEAVPPANAQTLAQTGTAFTPEPPDPPLTTPTVDIHLIDPIEAADGPAFLRRTSSLWRLGKVRGHDINQIDRIYIMTREPTEEDAHTTMTIAVDGPDLTTEGWPQYEGTWDAPQEMGLMKITSITGVTILSTGLTGTVAFTTTTGASGTFDLATHAWTITAAGTPAAAPQNAPSATPTLAPSVIPSAMPQGTAAPYPAP